MATIDISGDGGVVKRVLREAPSDAASVQNGDAVSVHYEGVVQGEDEPFDNSRDMGYPFSFKVGEGRVIRAWDLVLPTMKVGEQCEVTASAEYGYGDAGEGDDIPPGATLVFTMELVAIKNQRADVRSRDMERLAKIRAEREAKLAERAAAEAAEQEARRARIAANQASKGGRKKKKKKSKNKKK